MEWNSLFPAANQPTYEDMENYIGNKGKELWEDLFEHIDKAYSAKPKMTYSVCSGKPGWNVKFQKSGQSFELFILKKTASLFLWSSAINSNRRLICYYPCCRRKSKSFIETPVII